MYHMPQSSPARCDPQTPSKATGILSSVVSGYTGNGEVRLGTGGSETIRDEATAGNNCHPKWGTGAVVAQTPGNTRTAGGDRALCPHPTPLKVPRLQRWSRGHAEFEILVLGNCLKVWRGSMSLYCLVRCILPRSLQNCRLCLAPSLAQHFSSTPVSRLWKGIRLDEGLRRSQSN